MTIGLSWMDVHKISHSKTDGVSEAVTRRGKARAAYSAVR